MSKAMMKKYSIKHLYVPTSLEVARTIPLMISIIVSLAMLIFVIFMFEESVEERPVLFLLLFFFSFSPIFITGYLVKRKYDPKVVKDIHITIGEDSLNINNEEKQIFYNKIFEVKSTPIRDITFRPGLSWIYRGGRIGEKFSIGYNREEYFKLDILYDDEENKKIFYDFLAELKKKAESFKKSKGNIFGIEED